MIITKRELQVNAWGVDITLPKGTELIEVPAGNGPMFAVKSAELLSRLTQNTHDPIYRYVFVDPWECEAVT